MRPQNCFIDNIKILTNFWFFVTENFQFRYPKVSTESKVLPKTKKAMIRSFFILEKFKFKYLTYFINV